jgi:thymidylate synthase (FAD)
MSDTETTPQKLERFSIPAMDAILGQQTPVLDKGFIRVVDYMGGDHAVVQAARTSYGKGTKKLTEDRGLIRYLLRKYHTTPFEMAELKLHVKVPMDAWRQWIRHRTANVNEYSTRYSIAIDECQQTHPHDWRSQAKGNRQGSGDTLENLIGDELTREETELHTHARAVYDKRIANGVAREQARKDLPLSNYTEAYWKIDLHNLLHFLMLRKDKHAQLEIRAYADAIGNIVKAWCPWTWEAFEDYRIHSMQLSRLDIAVLAAYQINGRLSAIDKAKEFGWMESDGKMGLKTNREREEFTEKAAQLGIAFPW